MARACLFRRLPPSPCGPCMEFMCVVAPKPMGNKWRRGWGVDMINITYPHVKRNNKYANNCQRMCWLKCRSDKKIWSRVFLISHPVCGRVIIGHLVSCNFYVVQTIYLQISAVAAVWVLSRINARAGMQNRKNNSVILFYNWPSRFCWKIFCSEQYSRMSGNELSVGANESTFSLVKHWLSHRKYAYPSGQTEQ